MIMLSFMMTQFFQVLKQCVASGTQFTRFMMTQFFQVLKRGWVKSAADVVL